MTERRFLVVAACLAACFAQRAPSAWAIPPFFKEFQAKYVKVDSDDEKDNGRQTAGWVVS